MAGALDGITVLDFGHFIAGPQCGALLADFGADVIRIERPEGGNDREVGPISSDPATPGGTLYLQVNRNKRSLALDPFNPAARPVIDRLLAGADVVIANFPPKTLADMGLDYARIAAINPRIVLCTCAAFGHEGGFRGRPGFDGIGQAMSGAMHMTGDDGRPRRAFAMYVDHATAALSAFGVMAALRAREATGHGQQVEAALLGTALSMTMSGLAEEAALAPDRKGTGNLGQTAGPADIYRTTDGWVLLQVVGASMFRRCARLVGHPEWIEDPRFHDDLSRGEHGAELSAGVGAWCAGLSTADCLDAFARAGLPAAPVLSFRQALDDPDIAAQGYWQNHAVPGVERPVPIMTPPVRLSATPGRFARLAPALGADTEAILRGLGLDDADLAALKQASAI
ncbi:MAG: CaiB/BaiF CoA transferase family protein [Ferrovibrionaceae bacterium]